MKNKLALSVGSVLLATAIGTAAWVYNAYLVNEPALAFNKNYTLNLSTTPNASGITRLTAQAVYSTVTLPTDTFNDGRISTGSITVSSIVGLSTAAATNRITVAANAVIQSSAAYDSLTVVSTNGLTGAYVTLNGTRITNSGWRVNVASNTAADIATQINTYVYPVIATAASTKVNLVARTSGSVGNTYRLASSTPSAISISSGNFVGGQDDAFRNQYVTVNGVVYPRAYYWNQPNTSPLTSTGTAASLATLINTIHGIHASAAGSVVYATATVAGSSGNAFTISASTSALTVLTPTFTGGTDNACIAINGTSLCANTAWSVGASTAATAHAISDAIMASSGLNTIVVSTWNSHAVITTTSTHVGTLSNYSITSSTVAIVPLHATYVGGQDASFSVGSPNLYIPTHGYATGTAVLLSTGANTPPSPLVNQTTYYAILVDANDIQLATTSARAQAGQYLTFASSSTTGPHTFTLTPLAFAGTPGLQWQVSNDCSNFTNFTTTSLGVTISSLTFASPYAASATTWDLGPVNYECIRAAVVGPTAGGLAITVRLNGSN